MQEKKGKELKPGFLCFFFSFSFASEVIEMKFLVDLRQLLNQISIMIEKSEDETICVRYLAKTSLPS
jgi:hypothetical protein